MHLIQIFLPLYDNQRRRISAAAFKMTTDDLSERFGGLTAYTRAPAEGLWKPRGKRTNHDDLIIYEVMVKRLDRIWWGKYRRRLEAQYRQEKIVMRAQAYISL